MGILASFAVFIFAFAVIFLHSSEAGGAFSHVPPADTKELESVKDIRRGDERTASLGAIMQLLAERDMQEDEWRRREAIERQNAEAELHHNKRSFHYYGSYGKKSISQKRFNYLPSRG